MTKIPILVADDHGIVRKGLRFVLDRQEDMEVVAEAADGREAVRLCEQISPQVVVMDIAMPELNGLDAAAQIVRHNPEIKVIILSMHPDEAYLVRALNAGVKAYLLKGTADADLVRAVRAVSQGYSFSAPQLHRCWPKTTPVNSGSAVLRTRTSYSRTGRRKFFNCLLRGSRTRKSPRRLT